MRNVLLALSSLWMVVTPVPGGEAPSIGLDDDGYGAYSSGIFAAITRMEVCRPFRVMVVYWFGTDMLFVDETVPSRGESTQEVKRGVSILEFNHNHASGDIVTLGCKLQDPAVLRISGTYRSYHADETYSFRIDMDTLSGKYKYSDTQR